MTDHDNAIRRRYRELAREEPDAALDTAILAASRRALGRPSFTRRWGAPLSVAAVLMLAVGVTLNMQLERPGVEYSEPVKSAAPPEAQVQQAPSSPASPPALRDAASPPAASSTRPPPAPSRKTAPGAAPPADERVPAIVKKDAAFANSAPDPPRPQPFPHSEPTPSAPPPARPAPAAPPAAARIELPARAASGRSDAAESSPSAAMQAPAAALRAKREMPVGPAPLRAASPHDDPAQELERIARLRAEGRHTEADKALEEFRRRHPGLRIPEAMWERVKPSPP